MDERDGRGYPRPMTRLAALVLSVAGCGVGTIAHEPLPDAGGVERVPPEALPPAIDAAYLDCDADRWLVVGEVAGRAASARATLVRPGAAAEVLPMTAVPFAEGALWQRFEAVIDDPARPCERAGATVQIEVFGWPPSPPAEASDAEGPRLDCVAFGDGAAALAGDRVPAGEAGAGVAGCRLR